MKKNLFILMAVAAMLASGVSAYAEEEVKTDAAAVVVNAEEQAQPEAEESVELISEETEASEEAEEVEETEEVAQVYASNTATVVEVKDGVITAVLDAKKDAEDPENAIVFNAMETTVVVDAATDSVKAVEDIKADDVITVYTDANAPALLSLPAQYQADIIVIQEAEASEEGTLFTMVDKFTKSEDDTYVGTDGTSVFSLGEEAEIVDLEGEKVEADAIDGKVLAVFYSASTRSIPAIALADKVVVIGDAPVAAPAEDTEADADKEETAPEATPEVVDYTKVTAAKVGDADITNLYVKDEKILMLPVRAVAENLGMTVDWDGELRAVMINDGQYNLKIGENSYVKGKMAAQELSVAPEITNDLTFVPVEFVSEMFEAKMEIIESVLNISFEKAEETVEIVAE